MRMLGTGLLIPEIAVNGVVGNSTQVQQFFNRLLTLPSSARQTLYANLINGLVSDGVWSLLDALYVFAAADSDTSLTNLVQTSYKGTLESAGGGPNFTVDRGWNSGASNSNKVTSNFNPSTATSPNYVRNNASFGIWILGSNQEQASNVEDAAGDFQLEIWPLLSSNNTIWAVNCGSEIITSLGLGSPAGWWNAQRTASNAQALFHNGTSVATSATASVAVTNSKIRYGTIASGTNINAAAAIGASLSSGQQSSFYTRLQTYLNAVGAV